MKLSIHIKLHLAWQVCAHNKACEASKAEIALDSAFSGFGAKQTQVGAKIVCQMSPFKQKMPLGTKKVRRAFGGIFRSAHRTIQTTKPFLLCTV